jgi:ABC-type nickel/cobalt efflux system permease component RcnA
VTGGIVPCPTALIVLLTAVSFNRIGFGLWMILFFSIGLAGVLVVIGILMVKARGFIERFQGSGAWMTIRLPIISAVVIILIGTILTVQGLGIIISS